MPVGTVLVVDDDASIVHFLEMALEDAGYTVLAAVGGEALRVAHDRHPDVILLDLMMPGMDGIEVSHRLRADPATADIPLIKAVHARFGYVPIHVDRVVAQPPPPIRIPHYRIYRRKEPT